jgi:hypothetical protein
MTRMTFRNTIRVTGRFLAGTSGVGLLAVLISATVAWPMQEYAEQPIPAQAAQAQAASVQAQAASVVGSSLSRATFNSPMTNQSSESKLDLRTLAFNWHPSSGSAFTGEGSRGASVPSLTPLNLAKLANDAGGANAVTNTPNQNKHIGKGALALGILGIAAAAAGAVALSESTHNQNCMKYSGNSTVSGVCSDIHTVGEVLIPVGAAVAVAGFYFAFRHK